MSEYVQENNFTPGYSYVKVSNNAGYIARFSVTYTLDSKTRTYKSSSFSLGQSDKIYIPNDARIITLEVEEEVFIGKWVIFYFKIFLKPITKCYSLSGTIVNPKCLEIPCQGSLDNRDNTDCKIISNCNKCCYKCCKCRNRCNRY